MTESGSGGKLADFFVGLVDFFAVLLPGAILAFWVYKCIEHSQPGLLVSLPRVPEGWATFSVFAVVAYVFGHLLSAIGSLCLDPLYDWWKESYRIWPFDLLWEGLVKRQELEEEAKLNSRFGKIGKDFKKLATFVKLRNSTAAAEMDRLEADQK